MEKATVFGPGAADRVGGGVEVNDYISIPPPHTHILSSVFLHLGK